LTTVNSDVILLEFYSHILFKWRVIKHTIVLRWWAHGSLFCICIWWRQS